VLFAEFAMIKFRKSIKICQSYQRNQVDGVLTSMYIGPTT